MADQVTITSDGHDYRLSIHNDASQLGVYVYDADSELVGAAFLDHNLEQGHLDLERGSENLNYFEHNTKTPEELGKWVAGVYWQ